MTESKMSTWSDMLNFYAAATNFFTQADIAAAIPPFLAQLSQISGVGDSLILMNLGGDTLPVFHRDSVSNASSVDLLDDLSLLFASSECTRVQSERRAAVLQALNYPEAAKVSDIVFFSLESGANRTLYFIFLKTIPGQIFIDAELDAFAILAGLLENVSRIALVSRDGADLSEQLRQQHRRETIWLESLAWLNEMGAATAQINEQVEFNKAALFQLKLLVAADFAASFGQENETTALQATEVHGANDNLDPFRQELSAALAAHNFSAHKHVKWSREQHTSVAELGLQEVLIFPLAQGDSVQILFVIGKAVGAYDAHQEMVATLFADGVAHILERSHLLAEIRSKNQELERDRAEQAKLIKQLSEAQDQLLQQEKMASIGQLAAGVAHEINNPVGYVNSNINSLEGYINDLFDLLECYAKLEKSPGADPTVVQAIAKMRKDIDFDFIQDDVHDLVKESKEGVLRVKQIVKDLKDFSHVDEAEWQMADLVQGINSTLNIVHNELKYKANIVKEYDTIPLVECVPSQINQVVMNLLVNAGHAIEERGTITIRTKLVDQAHACFEVQDTGKGISEENLAKIFNPFFTTKPVGKGTGLGLSLSYSIIEKHGGEITVQSKVGEGTCFRVTLPIRQAESKVDV